MVMTLPPQCEGERIKSLHQQPIYPSLGYAVKVPILSQVL